MYPMLGVRFISIQENVDTMNNTGTELMPINNVFNEWYAAQTSKKIRAVNQMKAENGKRVGSSVPYGYMKNPNNRDEWLIDEPAADVVRRIFHLCISGKGPLQIAKQLEIEKIMTPTAYYYSIGRKTRNPLPENSFAWNEKTIICILGNRRYTGCTVNFATSTISYKVHKTIINPEQERQIILDTQPVIIDELVFQRVQELRESRVRKTATGRVSLFSGLLYCADCGSKLHFCASKSLKPNQEFYRCANYKAGRGKCQMHFIRNVVLEQIVLEAINNLADFVRCYEPVFVYLMANKNAAFEKAEKRKLQETVENGKQRISDLDSIISRTYEDNILGKLSDERYMRMVSGYEKEQKALIETVADGEARLQEMEQKTMDMRMLLTTLRELTDLKELNRAIINKLIARIEVHNSERYSGHCHVKVDIYFTAVGMIDIPSANEIQKIIRKIQNTQPQSSVVA